MGKGRTRRSRCGSAERGIGWRRGHASGRWWRRRGWRRRNRNCWSCGRRLPARERRWGYCRRPRRLRARGHGLGRNGRWRVRLRMRCRNGLCDARRSRSNDRRNNLRRNHDLGNDDGGWNWFRRHGRRDSWRRFVDLRLFGNERRSRNRCNRSGCLLDRCVNRWMDRRRFGNHSPSSGGRFDLPLQFQQIAPQSIAHLHAQVGEFQKSLSKFVLLPQEVDGHERRGNEQYSEHYSEHYEYELPQRHSPVCT